jgi:hypothetical protein
MQKKEPKPEPLKEDICYPFPDVEFHQKWQLWLAYRKENKIRAYKPIGLNNTFRDLFEISGGDVNVAMAIIDQSISKSWQGLFPLKKGNNGKQQSQLTNAGIKDAVLRNLNGQ